MGGSMAVARLTTAASSYGRAGLVVASDWLAGMALGHVTLAAVRDHGFLGIGLTAVAYVIIRTGLTMWLVTTGVVEKRPPVNAREFACFSAVVFLVVLIIAGSMCFGFVGALLMYVLPQAVPWLAVFYLVGATYGTRRLLEVPECENT